MTHLKKQVLNAAVFTAIIGASLSTRAQDWKSEKRINVLFGLAQPLIAKGFNIEGNYIHNRFIFDYSHGASLDFSGNLVPGYLRKQHLAVHEPWTTGFGVGYRLKNWINVRIEAKWHRFEFYYDDEPQNNSTAITSYNTFSLGLGVYGSYQPFKTNSNFLKGFVIAPSIRFWPTVSSGLKDDKLSYLNKKTGTVEEIKTLDPGTGFSPVVVNVSIGYTFQLKKKG
ncbi:hypothetical protein GCM10023149_43340 [Mucilaginibacter gynuensis]|uniref:Outer membrane protein beta-barrel domain-containing protein n=1 Tax=Mucilaginibacter gynuensis TaxID=1302236 RepID=A0ABP8H7G9_9SPHI